MMTVRAERFNLYFLTVVAVFLLPACKSSPEKKLLSVVALHLEVNRDQTGRSKAIPVFREKPVMVNLENSPFLSEGNIKEAKIIDDLVGFAVRLEFERRGAWLLEQYTTSNVGKRIGIYSEFKDPPESKTNTTRWLAAPVITQPIKDGVLTFTPDASREEMTSFVLGLNNLAKKINDQLKW
jgi:preprotein translocase subunit SecD